MTATTEELARRVCERWHELSPEDFRAVFAEDCIYQNMPIPGMKRGPEEIASTLATLGDEIDVKLQVMNLVATPECVMVDRQDSFKRQDGSGSMELPVVGVFEGANGKLTVWRDQFHFDPTFWETGGE